MNMNMKNSIIYNIKNRYKKKPDKLITLVSTAIILILISISKCININQYGNCYCNISSDNIK